jgi:hypothetical protein
MQVERCWRLLSEMDFIGRKTKVVAALRTGLTDEEYHPVYPFRPESFPQRGQ